MSNRFHQKFHRFNHHSVKNPNIADSGYDPIASQGSPFLGEFVLSGFLSAYSPNTDISIFTDNIQVDNTVYATNVFVTSTLTAEQLVVHYIDVVFSEASGYAINGTDFSGTVPIQCPISNVLLLSGIGLSGTSWASFEGDIQTSNNLIVSGNANIAGGVSINGCLSTDCIVPQTAGTLINISSAYSPQIITPTLSAGNITITGCLSTDCIKSNTGTLINIGSAYSPYINVNTLSSQLMLTNVLTALTVNTNTINPVNNQTVVVNGNVSISNPYSISALDVYATNVFGTNYYGITTDNLQINVSQGWRPAVIKYVTPQFQTWKQSLDNNTNYPSLTTDMFVFVTVSANDYRCYGEFEAIVDDVKVAGTKIGNIGLLPNANVEHALSAGLWLDEEKSFSFIAASGSDWQLNTLSGYYDGSTPDSNLVVLIAVYQQDLRQLSFAGDNFYVGNLLLNGCLSTNCIRPYTLGSPISVYTDFKLTNGIISNVGIGGYDSNQWSSVHTQVASTSGRWQSNWTTVNSNSAGWESTESSLNTLSGRWQSDWTTVNSNSASWVSTRSQVNTLSAGWASTQSTVNSTSARWQSNWTTVNSNSASWIGGNSAYTTVNSTSTNWGAPYISGALLAAYDSRYVNITGDIMTGNLDMGGFSITNIASGSLTFQGGANIHSDTTGSIILSANRFSENTTVTNIGLYSHAEGGYTYAQGNVLDIESTELSGLSGYAHSEGYMTSAFGQMGHAEGYKTVARGLISHAEGWRTIADRNCHSEGYMTSALQQYSHTEGYQTYAGAYRSHAEGAFTQALGDESHAEGVDTIAWGQCHAEGVQTVAGTYLNDIAHAEGYQTYALGEYSHSEGVGTIAEGTISHAEGHVTYAHGYISHAEGYGTSAIGDISHASGMYAIAANDNTWIWSNGGANNDTIVSTTNTNQFFVSATNGVVLGQNVSINGTLDMNGNVVINNPVANPLFTSAFQFDQDKVYQSYLLTQPITCVLSGGPNYIGKTIMAEISGPSTITFESQFKKISTLSYVTTASNYIYFNYIGNNKVLYTISQEQV